MVNKGSKTSSAAKILKIKQSTAKVIVRKYRKEQAVTSNEESQKKDIVNQQPISENNVQNFPPPYGNQFCFVPFPYQMIWPSCYSWNGGNQ